MRLIPRALALSTLAFTLSGGLVFAQDQSQDHQQEHQRYVHHPEWKTGAHIQHEDWDRGEQVDWRAHHLKRPRKGYEWREIDGNYVLATSDGVIASVVVAR
jgi:Ni/Co efflux regulator RcnB